MSLGEEKDVADFEKQSDVTELLRELSNIEGHVGELLFGKKARLRMRINLIKVCLGHFVRGLAVGQLSLSIRSPLAFLRSVREQRMHETRGRLSLVPRPHWSLFFGWLH